MMAVGMANGGVAFLMFMALCGVCFAAGYNVGDAAGWTLGINYKQWASAKKFQVGDTLDFNYNPQFHNVMQVTKEDYKSCNLKCPIATFSSGRDTITLQEKGHSYFVCGFPGHCQAGLKVEIKVSSSQSHDRDVPTPTCNCQPPPSAGVPNVPPYQPGFPYGTPRNPPLINYSAAAALHSSNLSVALVAMAYLFAAFAC